MKFSTPRLYFKNKFSLAAACFITLVGASASWLYLTTNPKKLFDEHYHSYRPLVLRGNSNPSSLKAAYVDGKMDSVIWEFKNLNSPVPEEYLLAGIAFLEENKPEKAIETFKILIQKNSNSKTDFFEDDAEYYLAMSYLSNNESDKAMPYFEKIKADPENHHYEDVSDIFLMKVQNTIVKK
jgi:tetratricopeptide (TPR) repeat protein